MMKCFYLLVLFPTHIFCQQTNPMLTNTLPITNTAVQYQKQNHFHL